MFDIPFYKGYKLTQDLQIIGKKGMPLTQCTANPHLFVNVYTSMGQQVLYLHRAVALVHHFEDYFDGAWVDHIDDNPMNNHPDNLQWVTPLINNNVNKLNPRERLTVIENMIASLEKKAEKLRMII